MNNEFIFDQSNTLIIIHLLKYYIHYKEAHIKNIYFKFVIYGVKYLDIKYLFFKNLSLYLFDPRIINKYCYL